MHKPRFQLLLLLTTLVLVNLRPHLVRLKFISHTLEVVVARLRFWLLPKREPRLWLCLLSLDLKPDQQQPVRLPIHTFKSNRTRISRIRLKTLIHFLMSLLLHFPTRSGLEGLPQLDNLFKVCPFLPHLGRLHHLVRHVKMTHLA